MKRHGFSRLLPLLLATVIVGGACSPDLLPVGKARLLSARRALQTLPRGPSAPGAFHQVWEFTAPGGYFHDPARIEISSGSARLRPPGTAPASAGMFRVDFLQTSAGRSYATLHGFEEVTGPDNHGQIRYQLSNGTQWYYHDGKQWIPAMGTKSEQANRATEIAAHISTFDVEVGPGNLLVRAFLIAPNGNEAVDLRQIKVAGVNGPTDTWD